MLNQTLNDAQIVAGISNLKQKQSCTFNYELSGDEDKPLLLICTQYLAIDDLQKWNVFIQYLRILNLQVDLQFYIDLGLIYEQIFGKCHEEDLQYLESLFGKPIDTYRDNQLGEIFYVFSKSSPFSNDARAGRFLQISTSLQPENADDRSCAVAVQLFRKFYLLYADYNFKHPNPFHIIKNSNGKSCDVKSVIEKTATLMMKSVAFVEYAEHHTSLFKEEGEDPSRQKEELITFLSDNMDLAHFIIMVYDLLNKVTEGDFSSTLILKHISLQILDPFIHPLAISILDFYQQIVDEEFDQDDDHNKIKELYLPKITFLNMDGFDYEFNYKLLNNFSESCQYIVIIDEMLNCGDQSKMFDLVTQDESYFKKAKNTYLIPIRSSNNYKFLNDMHFRHILDLIVYPLIRSFKPQVIIFSYSFAYFNQESDIQLSSKLFAEITTHLSLLSNYKVIFLPRILSSGIQIQDHRFEKELLNTDHKNIQYYLNNYLTHVQQSFKFLYTTKPSRLADYANNTMKIMKSNSFYEKKKIGTATHYILNKEKERYMFEILSGFLESGRKSYLQEVKDKDKRMQDPNLECQDLISYKVAYADILRKLYTFHKTHFLGGVFKQTKQQVHTYRLLSMSHQRTQKKEHSQFVSFLAQDLKDYVYVIGSVIDGKPQILQIYLRHLKQPVYIHNRLTQYLVNYRLKSILIVNVFSFKDIRELGIDSYQICLVSYEQYRHTNLNTTQIWAEIQVIYETTDPIFFRSLCFDKANDNVYIIYGKEAKFNTLCDQIDVFNFQKNTLTTMHRDKNQKKEEDNYFARAYASSLVFSFDHNPKPYTEVWTFGGSYLGHYNQSQQNMGFCNLVERIFIQDGTYKSQKLNKENIFPLSMRPMYGSLMISFKDNNESAILIIGGSQNELIINIEQQEYIGYKFQQLSDNNYFVSAISNQKVNPISFYQQNQNIFSHEDKMYIIQDATEVLGKSYRNTGEGEEFILTNPYSPYGILSITSLKITTGQTITEQHQRKKIQYRPILMDANNIVKHCNEVHQPFAQMHKSMKFYYKDLDDHQIRIIYQEKEELLGLIRHYDSIRSINLYFNLKEDENLGYLNPCSLCISYVQQTIYLLNISIENASIIYTIFSYPLNQLLQDINLSLGLNQNKLILNVYTVFAKIQKQNSDNIEKITKQLTCDNEALYLIGGNMKIIYQLNDLDLILLTSQSTYKYHKNIDNSNNQNYKIPFENPEKHNVHGQSNKFMFEQPYIIWTNMQQMLIIEKNFKQKLFSEVIDKIHHDFKLWMTHFEILINEQWEQGLLVLPSFLLKQSTVEMSSQLINDRLREQIQHRKLDLFLQNNNTDYETIVKIIDYNTQNLMISLVCAVQIQNFIQMINLEFSFEKPQPYLLNYKYNGMHSYNSHLRKHSVPVFIPIVTLLSTSDRQDIIDGYQIYEPINEFQAQASQTLQSIQIVTKLKEEVKVHILQA